VQTPEARRPSNTRNSEFLTRAFLALAFLLQLLCGAALAQNGAAGEPNIPEKAGKELHAYRITGTPPRIDGRLDDEVWTAAASIDDLVQNEPDNMQPPTERTVVQIAYDDRYLYIATRCFMKDPSQITTALGRRDAMPPSDIVRLTFDPRHDHLNAYTFDSNPSGTQSDYLWFDDTRQSQDYDAVWEVRTEITAEGWNAEFRIPFSQMRFHAPAGETAVWGFNVRRDIHRRAEFDRWVPTPRGVQGFVSRFGHLVFPERPAAPRRVEVLPYATTRREDFATAAAEHNLDAGVDVRVGLGTSTTLSATINPDFGQVEQDPAVLNLSVFETFFPEKRPFFVEDSRTFNLTFGQFPIFHSRRIGQRPGRIALPDGDTLIDRPDQTTILAATKLTGKSAGWTYGGLAALTAQEFARVETTTTDAGGAEIVRRLDRLVEPRTLYSVGRVQRDLRGATSTIGAIGTAVVRDGDADAFTGGIDYNFRWNRNQYQWDGHWIGTHAPISGVHENGVGGATRFNYNSKHVGVFGHLDHFSRRFRNTDIGFLSSRVNKTATRGGLSFGQPDPSKRLRNVFWFLNGGQEFTGDDIVIDRSFVTGMDIGFLNFWYLGWNTGYNFRVLDDLDTRGGPPIVRPGGNFYNLFIGSDSRKTWRLNVGFGFSRDEEGGWNGRIGPNVSFQPSPRLQTSVSTNFNTGETVAQWIENTDVTGDGLDDHVYGRLRRNIVDVTTRATYAFTRDLTLQLFLQPFVAVGDYTDIRRLAQPRSFVFESAVLADDPDFNRKSLRGNLVMRWEYRPGSTLFLVWNLSTSDTSRPGVFSPLRDLGDAFGADGTHVFMIKMNYWLGL
jgi:uncharacterized protein DUF5916